MIGQKRWSPLLSYIMAVYIPFATIFQLYFGSISFIAGRNKVLHGTWSEP